MTAPVDAASTARHRLSQSIVVLAIVGAVAFCEAPTASAEPATVAASDALIDVKDAVASTATDWAPLWAFPAALGAAVLIMFVVFGIWRHVGGRKSWNPPLQNLPTAYSFGDSLVTNVTLIAGVVTAVLGSGDVLKAISDEADTAVALAAVGGAISAGIVGVAPVVLQMCRRDADTAAPMNTALGLVLATGLTIGATGGQLWVLGVAADSLGIGSLGVWIAVCSVAAIVLAYGIMNIRNNLEVGAGPPTASTKTPEELILEAVSKIAEGDRRKALESKTAVVNKQLSLHSSRNLRGTSPAAATIIVEAMKESATGDQETDLASVLSELKLLRPQMAAQAVPAPRAAMP